MVRGTCKAVDIVSTTGPSALQLSSAWQGGSQVLWGGGSFQRRVLFPHPDFPPTHHPKLLMLCPAPQHSVTSALCRRVAFYCRKKWSPITYYVPSTGTLRQQKAHIVPGLTEPHRGGRAESTTNSK